MLHIKCKKVKLSRIQLLSQYLSSGRVKCSQLLYLVDLYESKHKNQTSKSHDKTRLKYSYKVSFGICLNASHALKEMYTCHSKTKCNWNTFSCSTHSFVDGKDGAYRGQTVNVGGTVQWVKTDNIFALWQTAV